MIAAFLFLLPAGAFASTLFDFIEHHPRSATLIRNSYRDALRDFEADPVFCQESQESADLCAKLIREQQTLLKSRRFGGQWIREQEPRPSPFGPVHVFRNPAISGWDGPRICEGVLSIPASSKHHKQLSFDLFCEEKPR